METGVLGAAGVVASVRLAEAAPAPLLLPVLGVRGGATRSAQTECGGATSHATSLPVPDSQARRFSGFS